jgi:hypothetical protein
LGARSAWLHGVVMAAITPLTKESQNDLENAENR